MNEPKTSSETNYRSILGTRLHNACYMVARVENAMLNVNDMWRFYREASDDADVGVFSKGSRWYVDCHANKKR